MAATQKEACTEYVMQGNCDDTAYLFSILFCLAHTLEFTNCLGEKPCWEILQLWNWSLHFRFDFIITMLLHTIH